MEYRILGATELRISAISLGCSRLGRSLLENSSRNAGRLLETAFDAGVNFFDTAPTYCYGDSERILGKTFAGRRDKVYFATKGGMQLSSYARFGRHLVPFAGPFRQLLGRTRAGLKRRSKKRQNFFPHHLNQNLESSLRHLRTDYIDLYQLHSPLAASIESDEVQRFLEECITSGKVRYCGASVGSIAEAQLCLQYPVFAALQLSFTVLDQEPATAVFPLARSRHVGVIVKTPLHRGLLTNEYRVTTGPAPELPDKDRRARRQRALAFLITKDHPTITGAALRFILDRPEVATVLTGTTNPNHLRSNLAIIDAGPLPDRIAQAARALRAID